MSRKSALAVLVACWAAWPASAWAASETDCAAQWKSADGNNDGVRRGPRPIATSPTPSWSRAHVTPVDGRITQQEFMKSCQSDIFMAKAAEPGAPIKGANSFTEGQAKDRIVAAGFTSVSSLVKDGDGVWRGSALKDGKSVNVAVDFKGNVVSQ